MNVSQVLPTAAALLITHRSSRSLELFSTWSHYGIDLIVKRSAWLSCIRDSIAALRRNPVLFYLAFCHLQMFSFYQPVVIYAYPFTVPKGCCKSAYIIADIWWTNWHQSLVQGNVKNRETISIACSFLRAAHFLLQGLDFVAPAVSEWFSLRFTC